MTSLQVLLLEDRLADVKLILHALEKAGFEPAWQHVQSEQEFVAALKPELDVILADYNLPQFDALRALKMVQERDLDVPFIVVTGTLEEAAMECVKQGAADYLLKDRLTRLGEAIKNALHEKQLREEKRLTEAALRESERQLRLAVNAARMGTWEWNIHENRIRYGGHYAQLLDIDDPETSLTTIESMLSTLHPADQAAVSAVMNQSLTEEEAFQIEFRVIRPDGSIRWMSGQGQTYRDANGAASHMSGVIQDITERKQAELRTRVLQEITATLSEAVTPQDVADAIIIKGLALLGGHVGTIGLVSTDGVTVDLIASDVIQKKQIPIDNGGPLTDAIRLGEPVWLENLEASRLRYPGFIATMEALKTQSNACLPLLVNQRIIGAIGLAFPTPGTFTGEDRALLTALAAQCAQAMERARLYANEQAARAVAEEANHLKTQFLAMVSHELRTPLTSIIGFITTLLSDDVEWSDEEQLSFLQVINEESQKLKELVEQLLDVSRLQAGMLSIHPSKQDVHTILSTAAAQLYALSTNHLLSIDVPEGLPSVIADEQRIAQVLVNLVDNATKYSPPATPITISARSSDHAVQFSVSDEGKGIPPEAYHQVFEAFHQLGRDSVPEKGVGLGLAICKALIEAHGGRIWIQEPGEKGTTISFTLPAASGE